MTDLLAFILLPLALTALGMWLLVEMPHLPREEVAIMKTLVAFSVVFILALLSPLILMVLVQ